MGSFSNLSLRGLFVNRALRDILRDVYRVNLWSLSSLEDRLSKIQLEMRGIRTSLTTVLLLGVTRVHNEAITWPIV